MTKIEKEKIQCPICGTEYEGFIVYSWNEQLSGPFPKDKYKSSCPKCGAPYRAKTTPSVGIAKDVLIEMISNPKAAGELLFDLSTTEDDLDKWKNVMLDMDYEEWRGNDLELQKSMGNLSENDRVKLDEDSKKREELAKLKQDGNIQELIEKVASIAREKIKEEKDTYSASQ